MRTLLRNLRREPTRIEVAILFLIGCGLTAYSFAIARHADLNAVHEPTVRQLIRHAYGGLLFDLLALLILASVLLPHRIQEQWLHVTQRTNRLAVYFAGLWPLLMLLSISSDAGRALQGSTVP